MKEIKKLVRIPVIANGSISCFEDIQKCLKETSCDGVMSAEAILEYPALFDYNGGKVYDIDDLALEYLQFVEKYEDQKSFVRSHIFKMLYTGFKVFTDLRDKMNEAKVVQDFRDILLQMKDR